MAGCLPHKNHPWIQLRPKFSPRRRALLV